MDCRVLFNLFIKLTLNYSIAEKNDSIRALDWYTLQERVIQVWNMTLFLKKVNTDEWHNGVSVHSGESDYSFNFNDILLKNLKGQGIHL